MYVYLFCSSTLLAPFCSFAICYCLSYVPFCFSFSSRQSKSLPSLLHYPLPVSSLLGLLLIFLSSPCFRHLLLDHLPLRLIFLKIVVLRNTPQKPKREIFKISVTPCNPYFYSGFRRTHWTGWNFENALSKGVRETARFLAPPRKGRRAQKVKKPQSTPRFKGRRPENTQFSKRKTYLMKKIAPPKSQENDQKALQKKQKT